ncbi:MAG: murein L,D-transpeptidase [Hyphomicrobium sp.]|nr:murein L,D-transpeptidase [Hyphomicrobium sp.]
MRLSVAQRLRGCVWAFAQVLACASAAAASIAALSQPASALTIELKDVAADRIERQRAAASGALPLPNTPNIADFQDRMRQKGVRLSAPIVIRVFKTESELEVWKEKDGAFVLFATYPICHWSGSVGPKMRDGDKQAPEGFYTVNRQQTRHVGRWPKSLNIGFPNILDQSQARTGDNILIHGGCSSVGCFAMTNPVMDEIHNLTDAAIDGGQDVVPIHVFPFRMTDDNMKANADSPWIGFWTNLKEGYDAFEQLRKPVAVSVCDGRYHFERVSRVADAGPLNACTPTLTGIREQDQWLREVPAPATMPRRIEGNSAPRTRPARPYADASDTPPG